MKRVRIAAPKEIQITNVPPAVQTKVKETKNAGTKQIKQTGKKKSAKDTGEKLVDKIRNFKSA